MVVIHLYSPLHLHLSLPLVGFFRNCLDACPIWTSWKLCEEILVGMTLFRCHISINTASSFGVVHLSSGGNLLLKYFFFCCWPRSTIFPEVYIPKVLTPSRSPELDWLLLGPGHSITLYLSHRPTLLGLYKPFNHPQIFSHPRAWPITQ